MLQTVIDPAMRVMAGDDICLAQEAHQASQVKMRDYKHVQLLLP